MSSVKYQHPTCNRTSRIAAGNDAAQAAHAPAHPASSLDPRARKLQQSVGNQGVLRMLRQPDASVSAAVISGAVQAAETGSPQGQPTQAVPPAATQAPPQPGQGAVPATGQPMPYTAMFSIAQHGPKAHSVCSLPDTPNCVVSWAKWRLVDATGAAVMGKVSVEEKFTLISGPAEVFKKLKEQENKSITSESGAFDDCYGLCVPEGTQDFTLKVQQNYLVNGQIAAQNILTYSSGGVMLQVCQREANGDFGNRCRRF
jgi:hypothetical protein